MMKKTLRTIGTVTAACLLTVGAVVAQNVWDDWDANGDGVGVNEWNEGFGATGVFDDWDADNDGLLSDDEFNEGVFNSYDENDDDLLDENEFSTFEDDAGDEGFWDI